MRIEAISIENFLSIGAEQKLYLADKGLNVLQGVNNDDDSASSNGSGKSTVLDALMWCLYGETARGLTGDAVIHNLVKSGCSVTVWLGDHEGTYTIYRTRKAPIASSNVLDVTYCDDGSGGTGIEHTLTRGTMPATQALITEQILGCSKEVFLAGICMAQENAIDLPALSDRSLKAIVEESAGIELLIQAYDVARGLRLAAEERLDNARASLDRVDDAVKLKAGEGARLRDQHETWIKMQKEKITALSDLRVQAAKSYDDLVSTCEKLESVLAGDRVKERIVEIGAELSGYDKRANDLRSKHDAEIRTCKTAVDVLESKLSTCAKELIRLDSSLHKAEKLVETACETCKRPWSEHDASKVRSLIEERLAVKIEERDRLAEEINEAKSRLSSAMTARDEEVATLPSVEALTSELSKLNARAHAYELKKSEEQKAKERFEKAVDAWVTATEEKSPYMPLIVEVDTEIAALRLEQDKWRETVSVEYDEVKVTEAGCEVFGPAGVRTYILDTVTPFLNTRTAHYLSILSDGNLSAVWTTLSKTAKGEVREKFSIDVENDKGGSTYRSLSGGEKRKVRLATALALQDLVASRATKPIDLFIGDEIDDALDNAGLERLMTILEMKARERGTVLLVSHSDMSSWCDNVTTVTKSGGASTIEGALCVNRIEV